MSLNHAVLIALHNEEGTGYEIAKWFDQGLGFFWSATHQQIYQELRKMTDKGMVTFVEIGQTGKPAKKVYSITDKGFKELKSWLEKPVKQCAVKDTLLMKIYSGHLIAPELLLQEINQQQHQIQDLLNRFQEIEKQWFADLTTLPLQQQYIYLTLRSGIIHAESWLIWSNEVVSFLENQIDHKP